MDTDLRARGAWRRVTRATPCPVCGKPDWCAIADGVVLCMRQESTTPSRGDAGGWLHFTRERAHLGTGRRLAFAAPDCTLDFASMSAAFQRAATDGQVGELAQYLGVTPAALRATGLGWCRDRRAWSWPMHDGEQRVVGIRLRDARTHRKYAVVGSKQGVLLATTHATESVLLVTEGPTDLAAALVLGFAAIGRPSCSGGTKHLVAMTRGHHVVVVADRDEPGRRGAEALATSLLPTVLSVRTIEPPAPHKDLRAWLQSGATRADVNAAIDATVSHTLRVRVCR